MLFRWPSGSASLREVHTQRNVFVTVHLPTESDCRARPAMMISCAKLDASRVGLWFGISLATASSFRQPWKASPALSRLRAIDTEGNQHRQPSLPPDVQTPEIAARLKARGPENQYTPGDQPNIMATTRS